MSLFFTRFWMAAPSVEAYQSLSTSERSWLQSLVDATFDAALVLRGSTVVECNQLAVALTGYEKEQLVGSKLPDIVPGFSEIPERALETRLHTRNGDTTTIQLLAKPVRAFHFDFSLVTLRAVTHASQSALISNIPRFVQSNVIGMMVGDPHGQIIEANDYCLNLIGYSRSDLENGKARWDEITPAEYRAVEQAALEEVRLEGHCAPYEKECIRPDGRHVFVLFGMASLDEGSNLVLAFVLDISRQKTIEQSLRQSEQQNKAVMAQLEALLASAPIGFAFFDREHRYIRVNNTLARINNRSVADHIGRTPSEITPDYAAYIDPIIDQVVASGESVYNVQVPPSAAADGGLRHWVAGYFPVQINGDTLYVGAVLTEVTEQKRAEEAMRMAKEAAEAANRAKSAFLANMSHEIRTPLTGIIGFASLIAQEASAEHRMFAEIIEQSGRRLMETLNAVLTLARLESGRLVLSPEPVILGPEITLCVQFFEQQAAEKGLDLIIEIDEDAADLEVPLDRGALASIMQNLVSNAIKYTDRGRVTVRAGVVQDEMRGRLARIEVEDTGIGIVPSFLPQLFDSFTQETSDEARTRHGTGLGLSIARQLVEKMNGQISVVSEKGRGSRFTVTFPLQARAATSESPSETSVPQPSGRRARILVVEDNTEAAILAKALLRKHYEVHAVPDAEEAIQVLTQSHFDLLFIDINLGVGADGIQLMTQLRLNPEYRHTPIVALTAYALPGDRDRFLEAGFSGYLSKPFTSDSLLNMAARLLEPS